MKNCEPCRKWSPKGGHRERIGPLPSYNSEELEWDFLYKLLPVRLKDEA
jgi:hypothetical protein